MRKAFDTATFGLVGLSLGLAASALPAAAASGARLDLSKAQVAMALGAGLWTRALASAFAGALVDRFGSRRGQRVAAGGATAAALALGLVFLGRREGVFFAAVAILHAALVYFLAFAGPAAARFNAARLAPQERGRHAGLYAALAFPAEFIALPLGLWLGSILSASVTVFLPAAAAVLALVALVRVPDGPEEAGPGLAELKNLASRAQVFIPAALDACAGAVRWGLLGWSAQFLSEVHHIRPGGPLFASALFATAGGAFLGPVISGFLSDKTFSGRRAPAALALFLALAAALFGLGRALDPSKAVFFLGAACAAAFGVHALLCGAVAMDAGGSRSAGGVSGLFDAAHHAAGGLAVLIIGAFINRGGWGAWTAALIPVSLFAAAVALVLTVFKAEARDPYP